MALCSTSQSPLSAFSKHAQIDRALQKDRLVRKEGSRHGFRDTRGAHLAEEFARFEAVQTPTLPTVETKQMILGPETQKTPSSGQNSFRNEKDMWLSEYPGTGMVTTVKTAAQSTFRLAEYTSFQVFQAQPSSRYSTNTRQAGSLSTSRGDLKYHRALNLQLATKQQELGTCLPSKQESRMSQEIGLTDSEWEAIFAQLETTNNSRNLEIQKETESAMQKKIVPTEILKENVETPDVKPKQTVQPTIQYLFEKDNPFSSNRDPFQEGKEIVQRNGNLSFAALAFEAACQQTPTNFDAWRMLGTVQAESEREAIAITSLNEALKLQPKCPEVMMRLAVCYTNEGNSNLACSMLRDWLQQKYPLIATTSNGHLSSTNQTLEHLKELYIRAAQLSPEGEHMDLEVQVALGILFFSTYDYVQAADCFAAAINSTSTSTSSQWPLHLLWTHYGACLGNILPSSRGSSYDSAKAAYETAISISPNSMRARYNLGVLQHTRGNSLAGARTLVQALRISVGDILEIVRVGTSHGRLEEKITREKQWKIVHEESKHIYDGLIQCCLGICRWDLAEMVGLRMNLGFFESELEKHIP